jgi:SAM-dependent methyltransferase
VTAAQVDLERERLRQAVPVPPLELRALVGPMDPADYDNPDGALVYPYLEERLYERVLDFGCGCGRVARQLMLQQPRPQRYLGIDLHRGMIAWDRRNLEPHADAFEFVHHDVYNYSFNPGEGKPRVLPFPAADDSFTLVHAWSVFTHLLQGQVPHYLAEVARVLEPDGVFHSTWFFFDKRNFPMMGEESNALYINDVDPTGAVILDRDWVLEQLAESGLVVTHVEAPSVRRGMQWMLVVRHRAAGHPEAEFPPDDAPRERVVVPKLPENAWRLGL